jgi:uncharacterized protein YbjT (DUF2867 family)
LRILVVGATGFIGRRLVALFRADGHELFLGVRARTPPSCHFITIDFTRELDPQDLACRLAGIDIVVNAAGILRESPGQSFEAVHDRGARTLFAACVLAGVRKVIQVSALGADSAALSQYHRSKRAADDFLAGQAIRWVIVQPSLVFGEGGASARLFATLAALPVIPLPGMGTQEIQPIHIDDLGQAMLRLIGTDAYDGTRLPAVGPRAVTLRAWVRSLRAQMGLGTPRFVPIPLAWVRAAASLTARLPGSPLDRETLAMLERGNRGNAHAISSLLERSPRAIDDFIPACVAERWLTRARLSRRTVHR